MDAGCMDEGMELGNTITPAVRAAFDEMAASLSAGEMERLYVLSLPERVQRRELSLLAMSCGGAVAGAICCRRVDDEAELVFGFLRSQYLGFERAFLEKAVETLARTGVHVIRTGFTWPGPGRFVAAATGMGFSSIRRISMARDIDERHPLSYMPVPGVNVLPWDSSCFEETCRIMHEESEPSDREVYPLFATAEGARMLLYSVIQDRHGTFMPGLSAVCEVNGRVAGFLLSSTLVDGSVLVLDIAVRKEYRRMGAGTKMLQHLISRCAAAGKRQVVLAVTASNYPAINLYRKMGFRQVATFDQHVLILESPGKARQGFEK